MNPDGREETPASPAPWTWRTTGMALIWSAGVFAIYLANGREIWSGDSVPAKYLTCALVRGDGFYLDRYRGEVLKWWPNPGMPYYVTMVDGHYVSRYPIGPVLVALPFTVPQMLVLDRTHPGWETSDPEWFDTIAKRSAAAITTLAALALLAVLRKLGLGREAWLAATGRGPGLEPMVHGQPEPLAARARRADVDAAGAASLARISLALAVLRGRVDRRIAGLLASDRSRVRGHDRPLGHDPASARPDLVPATGGGDRDGAHRLQPRVSRRRRRILFDLRCRDVRDPVAGRTAGDAAEPQPRSASCFLPGR